MKKSILIFLIYIFIIYNSLFADENRYIPSNVNTITSLNLNTLSKKADINLQETLNNILFYDYADLYLEYRNDPDVAIAMTKRLEEFFDTSKDTKILTYKDYNFISFVFKIKNSLELNKVLIKIATQEDKLVSISKDLKYMYILLDEKTLISWNDEVFTISISYDNSKNIIDISDAIFSSEDRLEDNIFSELSADSEDAYHWINLSELNNYYLKNILSNIDTYNVLDLCKNQMYDGILTAKYNFINGNANIKIDIYNTNSNLINLKKELSNKVFEYVNGKNNYGFFSISVNLDEVIKELKSNINNDEENNLYNYLVSEFPELIDMGITNIYSCLELLGGDIFFSAWDMGEEYDPAMFISVSIRDEDKIRMILSALSEDILYDDIYLYNGNYLYIKNSILYVVSYEEIAISIKEGRLPENRLDSKKLNETKDNLFSFYMDLNPLLALYGYDDYTEVFKDIGLYTKIISSNQIEMNIDINTKNQKENALKIIRLFMERN